KYPTAWSYKAAIATALADLGLKPAYKRPGSRAIRRGYAVVTALLAIPTALGIGITVWAFMVTNHSSSRLVLSTRQVIIGDTYYAIATGFSPGENVRFSWTGPSSGVMGIFPADSDGGSSSSIMERDPPGNYTITVTGLTSGRTASAVLRVIT